MTKQPHYTETENTTDDQIALRQSMGDFIHQLMSPAALVLSAVLAIAMTFVPRLGDNEKAWGFAISLLTGGAFGAAARSGDSQRQREQGYREPPMDWANYPAQPQYYQPTAYPVEPAEPTEQPQRPEYRGLLQNVELPGEQNDYEARLAEVNIDRIQAEVANILDGFKV